MSKLSGKVLFRENMLATYKNVVSNKGASGVEKSGNIKTKWRSKET